MYKIVLLLIVTTATGGFGLLGRRAPVRTTTTTTTTAPEATTTEPFVASLPEPDTTSSICPTGETAETCSVDCVSDYCAASEADSLTSCSPPLVCPTAEPICKCGTNERRSAVGGSCISVYDCPAFDCSARPNEVYNPCPYYCPTDDCSYAPFNGTCPPLFGNIGILLICEPKCTCAEGYWRNDGVCIPRAQCPSILAQTETSS